MGAYYISEGEVQGALYADVGQRGGMGEGRKRPEAMASFIKCLPLGTLTRIFSVECWEVEADGCVLKSQWEVKG